MPEGGRCYRKVDTGAGLIAAGAKLVAAGVGRWSLLQEGRRRSRTGSSGAELVAAGAVSKGIRLDFLN